MAETPQEERICFDSARTPHICSTKWVDSKVEVEGEDTGFARIQGLQRVLCRNFGLINLEELDKNYEKDMYLAFGQLATSVLVYHPHSLDDFVNSLQGVEEVIIENKIKLVIVDSIAALMPSENAQEDLSRKQNVLGHQAGTLKYLAEAFRIPIVVTNQVRLTSNQKSLEDPELQLTAALGTSWAHSVNIRLILESLSGQRFIKVAKSPMSAITLHPYKVTSRGLELIGMEDYGQGADVMRIHADDHDATEDDDMEV
ncbi:hypothetical protein L7F22_024726 [Adiantum nelumboides]|nr:hypothetical protein [Adiantum nelumboides]